MTRLFWVLTSHITPIISIPDLYITSSITCGDHSPHYLLLNVSLDAAHSVAHDIDPGHHKKSPLSSPHCQMLTTRLYEALYTAAAATCSSQASELQANNSHFKYTHKHTHFCSGDKWNDGKRKMFLPPFIPKISKEFVFRNPHKRIHFSHTASVCWIRGLITPYQWSHHQGSSHHLGCLPQ